MAKSYASSTTIPLAVIANPMRGMALRKVDAVKRDADREARRASSSISTLPQMGWSKRTNSISLKSAECLSLDPASRRNLDGLRLPAPSPSPKATGALSKWRRERGVLKLVL